MFQLFRKESLQLPIPFETIEKASWYKILKLVSDMNLMYNWAQFKHRKSS